MLFRSDRKSTRLNSSHTIISYAVFCLKKKQKIARRPLLPARLRNTLFIHVQRHDSPHAGPCVVAQPEIVELLMHSTQVLFFLMIRRPPSSVESPYTGLFR